MRSYIRRYTIFFLLAVNITALAALGYRKLSQKAPKAPPCCSQIADLNLTDQQSRQIKEMRTDYNAKRQYLWQVQAGNQDQLICSLNEDTVNRAKIDSIIAQMNETHAQLQNLTIGQLLNEKNLLDPEQRKQYIKSLRLCFNQACLQALGNENGDKACKNSECQKQPF